MSLYREPIFLDVFLVQQHSQHDSFFFFRYTPFLEHRVVKEEDGK